MLRELTLIDHNYQFPWTVEWSNCLRLSPSSLFCTMNYSRADPQRITDLCRAIVVRLCDKSLETITLENWFGLAPIQMDAIRPLFSLSRLRCVRIAHLCTLSLSDDDLLELATSWPLLEVLSLNYFVETKAPRPTLKGFCQLLQHCPHLQKLTIVIDATDSEWIDIARPCVRNHLMDYLCLGNSLLDDRKRVASILLAILPSLKELDTAREWAKLAHRFQSQNCWEEVNYHLGELRKGRDSDRRHAQEVLQPVV
ncbi:hypothetical protein OG21DRAFT_363701 [Imleria badia]|nr:hypothetical protein OG21DRAFT_363701 [Imleria badia]